MKKFFTFLFIAALGAGGFAYYFYQQKTEKTTTDKSIAVFTSKDLLTEFNANEAGANKKYGDQTITLEGTVFNTTVSDNNILIELEGNDALESVICNFDITSLPIEKIPKIGESIKIKGKFIAFTIEPLMETKTISMVQCLII